MRESYKVVREKSGLNRYAGLLFKGLMVVMFSILGIINKELKIRNKEVEYVPIFYTYNRYRYFS